MDNRIIIAGIRGVPASHGGFEAFAHDFSLYLVEKGWDVTVFCQDAGAFSVNHDTWHGVKRVRVSLPGGGQFSTIVFDFICTLLALRIPGKILVLGYNTAIFSLLYRLFGRQSAMNMDGIEWKRGKWGAVAKAWFYLNERFGCWFSDKLIADHPEIQKHLFSRGTAGKITVIPYGARRIEETDESVLSGFGLLPAQYAILVARPEPENSILEIVTAFSRRKRNIKLIVLGSFSSDNPYHVKVKAAASDQVVFVGAIYDKPVVEALRFHALFYLHGHTVGGTNPSLVEALAAGSPVIAHDNAFNRWVMGDSAGIFFADIDECDSAISYLCANPDACQCFRDGAYARHAACFTLDAVHRAYENLLTQ